MTSKTRQAAALVFAAVMVTSMFAGAAALTTDTETTNSAGASDLTGSTVVEDVQNDSVTHRIQIKGDSNTNTSSLSDPGTEMKVKMVVNDSNSDIDGKVLATNASNFSSTAVSGAPDHYYTWVDQDAWNDALEYGAEENVTVDARVVFNESESDESVHNITFTVAPNGSDARVSFATAESNLEENQTGFLASIASVNPFSSSSDPGPAKANDSVNITPNTTNVTMTFANQNVSDSASHVVDNSDGYTTTAYANVDGQAVPVVVGSASDISWLDTSSDAYIHLTKDDATLKNAGSLVDSQKTVDTTLTLNEDHGYASIEMLQNYGASWTTAVRQGSIVDVNGEPEYVSAGS